MRAGIILLACLAACPAAGRDLGTMPFSGQVAIEWTTIEPMEGGDFIRRALARHPGW